MKICATNLSYQNLRFNSFIDKIKLTGYKNIELAPFLVAKNPFEVKTIIKLTELLYKKKVIIESFQSIFYKMDKSCIPSVFEIF